MSDIGRALRESRACRVGSLGLLCVALSARPAPARQAGADDWSRALQAARADREAADPEGKYFGVFVKRLAQIQGPAVRACRAQYPETASSNFQALARLSKDGNVQQLLMKPSGEFQTCVRNKLRASLLPPPPKAPYWIFWGNLAAPGN